MKTYMKVIIIFLALLIVLGSVMGWNLTSFDAAKESFAHYTDFVNYVGMGTLEAVSFAFNLGDYWVNKFTYSSDDASSLPYPYQVWSKPGLKDFAEIGMWYVAAWQKKYGIYATPPDVNDMDFFLKSDTLLELYHLDLLKVIEYDDFQSYNRISQGKSWRFFKWWFSRNEIKEDFKQHLLECEFVAEHNCDLTAIDIIIKYELGG